VLTLKSEVDLKLKKCELSVHVILLLFLHKENETTQSEKGLAFKFFINYKTKQVKLKFHIKV